MSGMWDHVLAEASRQLRRSALPPRHRLGWRCVALVLRQSPYRQRGTVLRRIVMGRLSRWVRLGVVIIVASLTLGTASIAAHAAPLNDTPQALVHVH